MNVWTLIIVIGIVLFLLEKLLIKLLGIKKQKISETNGNKVYHLGILIILVISLFTVPFEIMYYEDQIMWFSILNLIALLGLQSIIELKYLKETKQYIVTLTFLVLGVILLYNLDYFILLSKS